MAKHQSRDYFLPGAGRHLWCRLCTCVSTRQDWTQGAPRAHACPVCGAPGYEARLLRPDEFSEEMPLGVPYPVRGRNPGYVPRQKRARE